jgi:cysteinyl-tRNA synthetase
MGRKYLGERFDIHGGGMDLIFPHHECEIAQAVAAQGHDMVNYWIHNNMITINGQKMGKSLGNFITLNEFFTGNNENLQQPYSPMTIRFFILMSHYRGTVDFSNEALQAAEKAMNRLLEAYSAIDHIVPATESTVNIKEFTAKCYEAMNDDLNTPITISHLFDAAKVINQAIDGNAQLTESDVGEMRFLFDTFLFDILGIRPEYGGESGREEVFGRVVDMLLEQRSAAKAAKDWAVSDKIRDELAALGFEIKDTKDGTTWKLNLK